LCDRSLISIFARFLKAETIMIGLNIKAMKRRKRLFWFCFALIMIGSIILTAAFTGDWLSKDDDLGNMKAEAIVVLAGQPLRSLYAADLYKKGFSAKIYISSPYRNQTQLALDRLGVNLPKDEEINVQILLKKDVPLSHIFLFGKSLFSTLEEAEALGRIFDKDKSNLIIVTSPYHVRRTRIIFKDVLKNCDVRVVGSKYETYPDKWWTDRDAILSTTSELQKIIFYKMGGQFHQ
jgi:uncharacterized SAM-binding protein YcdF (DUF218 family)